MTMTFRLNEGDLKQAILNGGLLQLEETIVDTVADRAGEMFERALAFWGEPNGSRKRGSISGDKVVKKVFVRKSVGRIKAEVFVENDILYFVSEGTSVNWTAPNPGYLPSSRGGTYNWGPRVGTVSFINSSTPAPGIRGRKLDVTIAVELQNDMSEILSRLT